MSNESDYQAVCAAATRQSQRIKNISKLTADQIDAALAATEYCADGVAIGQAAYDDQAYRRAIKKHQAQIMFPGETS